MNKTYAKSTDAVIYEIKYITIQNINNQNIDRGIPLNALMHTLLKKMKINT